MGKRSLSQTNGGVSAVGFSNREISCHTDRSRYTKAALTGSMVSCGRYFVDYIVYDQDTRNRVSQSVITAKASGRPRSTD